MAAVFIDKFRNLSGSTLGEKKRNLNALFVASAGTSPIVLAQIAEELKPETALEKLFYAEFLLHFQVFPQLYRQFLACDELTLAKVANKPWFFQRVFEQAGPEFVTELFPKIGRRLKLKFLNKIELNEAQADAIYDVISAKYGEGLALQILTKCSAAKIEALIQNHYLKLWPAHLKLLYKKNPQLIYKYFDEIVRTEGIGHVQTLFYELKPLAEYIARADIEMFLTMKERYKLDGRLLGKRTTLKLIENKRADVAEHPEKYLHYLRNGKVVRKLGKDFRSVYSKLFPRELSSIYEYNPGVMLLKYFAKKGRGRLFMETFKRLFEDIKPGSITEQLLKQVPDVEFRQALAKIKIDHGQVEGNESEAFVKFYEPSQCFDIIKKRWNFASSSSQRSDYAVIIIEACILNEDYDTLAQVLEFVGTRMRNDDVYAKYTVVRTLHWSRFDFKKLHAVHWKFLIELVSGIEHAYQYEARIIFYHYLFYVIRTKQPADVVHMSFEFFKKEPKAIFDYKTHLGNAADKETEKLFLTTFLGKAPQGTKSEIDEYNKALVLACASYNESRKDSAIVLEASLLVEMSDELNVAPLYDVLLKTYYSKEISAAYWANLKNTASLRSINWFLRYKPQELTQNFDALLEAFETLPEWDPKNLNCWKLWKDVKYFGYLGRKASEFYTGKLEGRSKWLALPLSILADDYLSLMQPFKPVSDKNDDQKELSFQKALIKRLKNTSASVPAVLELCRGDYLAEALVPLCSALYKLPEDEAKPHLEALQKTGAVSVKKHGLFLSCALLDQATAIEAIKSSKLQPQSLTSALKYFQRNPTEAAFEVVKMKLPKVNKNDKFTNKLIVDVVASGDYRARYFDLAWSVLNETGNVQWKKVLLTKAKEGTLTRLSAETLAKVIESDFMKAPKMDEFTTNVLFYSSNHEPVYQALERFKRTEWESDFRSRKKLSQFIETFFNAYMAQSQINSELAENFAGRLQAIFKPFEAYEELAIVNLMEFKGQPLENLAASIVELNNGLIAQYGQGSLNVFAESLKKFSAVKTRRSFHANAEKEKLELLRKMLEARRSLDDALLVVKLLPEAEPEEVSTAEVYNDLMAALEGIEEDSLKLHLNVYFKSSDSRGAKRKRQGSESEGVRPKRMLLPTKKR